VHPHDANRKGSVAELKIAAAAADLGVHVLQPMTEHGRYDLVFEIADRLLRVQCKWARVTGDVVVVPLCNSRITTNGFKRTMYQPGEIDALAAYCGDLDRVYLLPVELVVGRSALHLRLRPTRNGQRAALNWAVDYELSGAVAQWNERPAGSRKVVGSNPTSSTRRQDEPRAVQVGAHEFRNLFGYYAERAAAGEEIHVTRRGKPYVRLLPAATPEATPASRTPDRPRRRLSAV
jgi:prevent-host-death family protein